MDAAERAAKIFIRRYEALNEEYLEIIGERIRAIGRVSPTDLYRLERLRDIGADMNALKRKLASETGKSLKDSISEYRIQKAKELLLTPNVRIGEVAMQVGFDSFTYFSTMFKKYTGVTPNEYRKNLNVDTKEE